MECRVLPMYPMRHRLMLGRLVLRVWMLVLTSPRLVRLRAEWMWTSERHRLREMLS